MEHFLNYEGGKIFFTLPPGWNVISNRDSSPPVPMPDTRAEIERALDRSIGSKRIEEVAKPGMTVTLLFDDLQRPTPADLALPAIMNRLNRAGVKDEMMQAVCACGTHPIMAAEQLRSKVGDEVWARLGEGVSCHDAHSSENVIIGRTHRGALVELNPLVTGADLVIGVGECMPHPGAGYGGGYKIVMPGAASFRSVAEHHVTYSQNRNTRVNLLDTNPFWEEIVDAGRLTRLLFKLDLVMNHDGQVIRAFAGDPVAEQREAARFAESLYLVTLPHLADITVTSASPLEIGVQATKALSMAGYCTRSGGTIIWVASQRRAGRILPLLDEVAKPVSANQVHRQFAAGQIPENLKALGLSYAMQVVNFKEMAEKFRVFHVTEGLTAEQVPHDRNVV